MNVRLGRVPVVVVFGLLARPVLGAVPPEVAANTVRVEVLASEECWMATPGAGCTMVQLWINVHHLKDGNAYWDRSPYDGPRAEMANKGYSFAWSKAIPAEQLGAQKVVPCQGFAGAWHSNFGGMQIAVSGNRATGNYTSPYGTFEGTVTGGVLEGLWTTPGYPPGPMRLVLSTDRETFEGNWRNADGSGGSSWSGKCVGPPQHAAPSAAAGLPTMTPVPAIPPTYNPPPPAPVGAPADARSLEPSVGAAAGEVELLFAPMKLEPAPLPLSPVGSKRPKPHALLTPRSPRPTPTFFDRMIDGLGVGVAHAGPVMPPTVPVMPAPRMGIKEFKVYPVPKYKRGPDACPDIIDQEMRLEVSTFVEPWPYPFVNPYELNKTEAWRHPNADNPVHTPLMYLDFYVGGAVEEDRESWTIRTGDSYVRSQASVGYEPGKFEGGQGSNEYNWVLPAVLPAKVRVELWASHAIFTRDGGHFYNNSELELVEFKEVLFDVGGLADMEVHGAVRGDPGRGLITGYSALAQNLGGATPRNVSVGFDLAGKPNTAFGTAVELGQAVHKRLTNPVGERGGPIKWNDPTSRRGRMSVYFGCPGQDRDMRNNVVFTK